VTAPEHYAFSPRFVCARGAYREDASSKEAMMHGLIYLIGLIVVIMAVLSLLGLR